jgi:hypothetical protein
MKKTKKINGLIILLFISSAVSCQNSGGDKKSDTSAVISANTEIPEGVIDSGIAAKTFNQYNESLSKLTGVDLGQATVNSEYLAIRNSLPAGHETSSFTPFHQVSVTRLAFAYCDVFIEGDTEFSNLDYAGLSGPQITSQLLEKFIGSRTPANGTYYDGISSELNLLMNNDAGNDETGNAIGNLIPNTNGTLSASEMKINLTKLSCTTLLASAEFSVL